MNTKAEIPGSLIIEEAGAFESEGVDDKTILLFKHLVSLDQESITQKELVQQLIDEYCWKKVTAEKLIQRRLPVSMPVDIAGYTIRRTGRGKAQKHIHIKAKRQADTSPM